MVSAAERRRHGGHWTFFVAARLESQLKMSMVRYSFGSRKTPGDEAS